MWYLNSKNRGYIRPASVVYRLRDRLSEFHEHMTLLPWLAQVISLVGWPKLVKFFFFFYWHTHSPTCLGLLVTELSKPQESSPWSVVSQVNIYHIFIEYIKYNINLNWGATSQLASQKLPFARTACCMHLNCSQQCGHVDILNLNKELWKISVAESADWPHDQLRASVVAHRLSSTLPNILESLACSGAASWCHWAVARLTHLNRRRTVRCHCA